VITAYTQRRFCPLPDKGTVLTWQRLRTHAEQRATRNTALQAGAGRDQAEHRIGDPDRQIEKRRVNPHGKAPELRRRPTDGLDPKPRIDRRVAETPFSTAPELGVGSTRPRYGA
jgi:hypothetical protein